MRLPGYRFGSGFSLVVFACALGLCGIIASGCQSTSRRTLPSFASVEIHGNTPGQIGDMGVVVFEEKGYKLASRDLTRLVFEKQGSHLRNLAYGNWLGGPPIWIRVKASIVPTGQAAFKLECQAFMIRGRGEPLEEEIAISNINAGPYQKLLDEVAGRLAGNRPR